MTTLLQKLQACEHKNEAKRAIKKHCHDVLRVSSREYKLSEAEQIELDYKPTADHLYMRNKARAARAAANEAELTGEMEVVKKVRARGNE